ncbi:MAG: 30S ribosomal protein S18 [SAR86 cluster bacterium]|uniref:Small ribosomal subunit protein bS18 n=1 Tax=SAR86 cluster bacterium TaxID=2030880 RepID=A0A368BPH7_9GAMM|nr:MAG: 30S ribosomal protein S18 [SAR86 cluster bacterium]|tara:strand:- start:21596 stop:21802 length:207 start_codon:yes stop_codon:yes gene_type:complete
MSDEKKINFDYKDADSLRPFISENGKILSTRYTRLNAKQQRKLNTAIKRARVLGIIPFTDKHKIEESQ